MILCDDDPQPQERHRQELVRALAVGLFTAYVPLPVDNAFYGFGANGAPIQVGVEVKKADDMARCVTQTGRLAQQLRNAHEFGMSVVYLVHQGIVRPSKGDGLLEKLVGNGQWAVTDPPVEYRRWDNFLTSLMSRGVMVKRTSDPYESAQVIVDLYHWWQKPPEDHQSLDRFYQPVFLAKQVPLFRKLVKEFPGVSLERSLDWYNTVAGTGASVLDVLSQDQKEWQKVKGIGKGVAGGVWRALHEPIVKEGGCQ